MTVVPCTLVPGRSGAVVLPEGRPGEAFCDHLPRVHVIALDPTPDVLYSLRSDVAPSSLEYTMKYTVLPFPSASAFPVPVAREPWYVPRNSRPSERSSMLPRGQQPSERRGEAEGRAASSVVSVEAAMISAS